MMAISRTLVCLAYLLVAVGAAPAELTCDCGLLNRSRVASQDSFLNSYPMLVVVLDIEQKLPLCDGTIITSRHVLTGTNCTVKGISNTKIWVPASRWSYIVEKMITHKGYNEVTGEHDIAIIVTWVSMTFENFIGPVCMPTRKLDLSEKEVRAVGWGKTASAEMPPKRLLVMNLKINGGMCKNYRGDEYIPSSMLCTYARSRTVYQDYVGGPVMWLDPATQRYTLVGINLSAGDSEGSETSLNTDVSAYIPWINQKIAEVEPRVTLCTKRLSD